jgi:hypothetical protein
MSSVWRLPFRLKWLLRAGPWLGFALACTAAGTHAQDAEAVPVAAPPPASLAAAPSPSTPSATDADSAVRAAPQAPAAEAPATEAPARLQLTAADVVGSKHAALQAQLVRVDVRRARLTRVWPLLLVGAGALAVFGGGGIAAAESLACDGRCAVPPWTEFAVVIGAAMASGGAAWLVRVNHTLRQLDLEQHYLQDQLERAQSRSAAQRWLSAGARPALSLRLHF